MAIYYKIAQQFYLVWFSSVCFGLDCFYVTWIDFGWFGLISFGFGWVGLFRFNLEKC